MGLMRVLGFRRTTRRGYPISDVAGDTGGGNRVTAEHYQPAGDDAYPLPDDHAATIPAPGSGRLTVVAYADPNNEQLAKKGEKRIYARDENGNTVAWAWLKNTGEAEVSNGTATLTLAPDGTITLGNDGASLTMDNAGNITLSGAQFDWQAG